MKMSVEVEFVGTKFIAITCGDKEMTEASAEMQAKAIQACQLALQQLCADCDVDHVHAEVADVIGRFKRDVKECAMRGSNN